MSLDLYNIRREYGHHQLDDASLSADPLLLSQAWLADALDHEVTDPTAMVLSTVDAAGSPDARVVLLKAITGDGFVFYTHFKSTKGEQLAMQPHCALTLYWPTLARQLRVRGRVQRLSEDEMDTYFSSRPYLSQLSACVSPQSQPIANRQVLQAALTHLQQAHPTAETLKRPTSWGGYVVKPSAIEFWQGRDNRLHDRLLFTEVDAQWVGCRLAP